MSYQKFQAQDRQAISLLGMSGIGKTRLARLLRQYGWFHYSGDYRIGTRYLDEAILDNIKYEAMKNNFLKGLLLSDSIYIEQNLSIDNLQPVASFLGKLGDPMRGGLGLREFKRRLSLHHDAEIAAMLDVPRFTERSFQIYGYKKFVNDAGGSLCELADEAVLNCLAGNTIILYIQASQEDEQKLLHRAKMYPKPMYYREAFLDKQLAEYLRAYKLEYAAHIEPEHFASWIFPRLFHERIPRYTEIAKKYGYTLTTEAISKVKTEADFLNLLEQALDA